LREREREYEVRGRENKPWSRAEYYCVILLQAVIMTDE